MIIPHRWGRDNDSTLNRADETIPRSRDREADKDSEDVTFSTVGTWREGRGVGE